MFSLRKKYSATFFAIWRIAFGLYLTGLFLCIFPYAGEIYLDLQWSESASALSIWGPLNIFQYFHSHVAVECFFIFLTLLAIGVTLGFFRRTCALLLFYGWSVLYIQNSMAADPSTGYIGLLLLALAVVPIGEPYTLLKNKAVENDSWFMPAALYWGMWLVLGLSFSMSGYGKSISPLWSTGEAVTYMVTSQIGLGTFLITPLLSVPLFAQFLTWVILYSQLLALPALIFSGTRLIFWLTTVVLFSSALFMLDLTDVIFGILLYFAFIFDDTWIDWYKKMIHQFNWDTNK